jgi:phenylalanyl-tRNA synthetase beta chain
VTLDGVERALNPSDIVVADAERAVSLAGIMGGLETSVTEKTKNVLLEAAWWDPVAIRRTSRRLGIHTDASHRFERGADPEAIPAGLNRAARIILESAGGSLASGMVDTRGQSEPPRRAALRLARLLLVAGDERLDLDFAEEALSRLGFSVVRRGKHVTVLVPSFRRDVSIEDDLVEEVLRVYGYEKIPSRLPPASGGGRYLEPLAMVERLLSDRAAGAGLFETVNYPFVNRSEEEGSFQAWLTATGAAREPLAIANPLDLSRRHLRATLLPGLLDALARNVRHGRRDAALFETGRVFGQRGEADRPESFEERRLAFAISGDARADWSLPAASRRADFFDAKGLLEGLLAPWAPAQALSWHPFQAEAFTPGAAATVRRGGTLLGVAGLIGEKEREKRKLSEAVFAGEILIEAIPLGERATRFEPFSAYPPVEADVSFSHSRERPWGEIEAFVRGANLVDLESFRLLDRYQGEGVLEGAVKTTIRLVFRSPDRTLEQEGVNRAVERLARDLESRFGAKQALS